MERNDNGINALHGGTRGFAARWWTIVNTTTNAVTLRLRSPEGDAGYPASLDVRVIYCVEAPARLTLEVMATTDAPTLVNICHHPYFTFDGARTISAHILWIDADRYLTADASLVPINPVPVAGTPFDFRRPRPVGDEGTQFNNTYCIGTAPWQHLRKVARLSAGGIEMALSTTQPGLHFYDGYKVTASNDPACGAQALGPRSALCLEAQGWPDAPNRPDFPSALLERRQIYRHRTEYAFSRLG